RTPTILGCLSSRRRPGSVPPRSVTTRTATATAGTTPQPAPCGAQAGGGNGADGADGTPLSPALHEDRAPGRLLRGTWGEERAVQRLRYSCIRVATKCERDSAPVARTCSSSHCSWTAASRTCNVTGVSSCR